MPPAKPTFVLLQRNPRGGLTRDSRDQAKQLAPDGFTFKLGKGSDQKILQELQDLLPKNVLLAKGNPFAVLKITPVPPDRPQECMCKCGTALNCSGSGSGTRTR
jgi:hypothetical protein